MAFSPWYKEMAVYQIWPRSFCDGNGDGKVNGADYIMLRRLILGLEKDLDLINIRAMSISTHSVNPTSADYVALRKYILENN